MFLISDGKAEGVSTTFPFPYSRLKSVLVFEQARRRLSAPWLIGLELAGSALFVFLILSAAQPTLISAFAVGFASIVICLKMWIQRKVKMLSSRAKIVGIAPAIFWIEHLTLCSLLFISAILANTVLGHTYFQFSILTSVQVIAVGAAIWPFCMVALFAHKLPRTANS